MQFIKYVLFVCLTLQTIINVVRSISYDDLSDYDNYDDDDISASYVKHIHPDLEMRKIEKVVLSQMAEDEPKSFTEKEKRMRNALFRSTQDMRNRRTLSELMPILRSLSKHQRLALAALIATQANTKSSKALDLKQVRI